MESNFHPVPVCVLCDRAVYARYMCRAHYEQHRQASHKEAEQAQERDRAATRQERKEEIPWKRESNAPLQGQPCRVASCEMLTLQKTGLCVAHGRRAKHWQFTPDALVEVLSKGECESCGSTEDLVLDHAHGMDCEPTHKYRSGCPSCFRGLLCNGCNRALGFVGEVPERLYALADYIRRFEA